MNRMQLMKIHALFAAFILPVTIMFMVTGALYTWGIKGSYTSEVYEIPLTDPIQPDVNELKDIAQQELLKLTTSDPEGLPVLKVYGNHFLLEWTGSSKDVILEPTDNALIAKLTVKNTTWYRNLVQLHKAKGGIAFKIYAVILALSILTSFILGFIMAWHTPQLKRLAITASLLGLCSFFVFIYLS